MFESMGLTSQGRPPRFLKSLVADMPFMPTELLGVGQRTTHTMSTAPCDFSAVALILVNIGASLILDGACVAVSESSVDKINPLINGASYPGLAPADSRNGWVPVTFGGNASVTMGAGTLSAPWFGLSDFVPLTSIPRRDGGKLPLIMRREYYNNRAHQVRQSGSAANAEATCNRFLDFGREYYNAIYGGDGVSTPASFTGTWAPGAVNNNLWCAGFVFQGTTGAHTVVLAGDSIMQGGSASSTPAERANGIIGGWGQRAAWGAAKQSPFPVGVVNAALAGATPAEYSARFKSLVNAGVPMSVLVYPPWSPNTFPPSGRIKEGNFLALAADAIEFCRSKGAQACLACPTPYSVGYLPNRAAVKARIKKLPAPYIDFANSGAENADGTYATGANFDTTHPSDFGHELLAGAGGEILGVIL